MPLDTQAKILRALETREAERVGGSKPIRFDVRVLAATNKNIAEMIESGRFREDLYHRLNVFPIYLRPLRDRRDDIPLLAEFFLRRFSHNLQLSSEALAILMTSPWPGNVRELRNLMERAAVLAQEGVVLPRHLPGCIIDTGGDALAEDFEEGFSLEQRVQEVEVSLIRSALLKSGGVQVRAAQLLGVKERSLWHRIKKYEIDVTALKAK